METGLVGVWGRVFWKPFKTQVKKTILMSLGKFPASKEREEKQALLNATFLRNGLALGLGQVVLLFLAVFSSFFFFWIKFREKRSRFSWPLVDWTQHESHINPKPDQNNIYWVPSLFHAYCPVCVCVSVSVSMSLCVCIVCVCVCMCVQTYMYTCVARKSRRDMYLVYILHNRLCRPDF